jgi:1-acyl-sn-glycerol-3-phosphate acyltransferase
VVRRPEPWFRFAATVLRPPIALWFNWRFEGREHIPKEGPLIVACNHVSYFDPLAHALMMVKSGRRPRFLTKSEMYKGYFMRHLLEGAKQIKVERGSGSAAPVKAAIAALAQGETVMIYPEATITRNPDFTPMQGKTGMARIALASGAPVVPVAVWGSQHVAQKEGMRSLSFGRPIWLKAGAPVDFSAYEDGRDDTGVLREITDSIMDDLTRLVNDLRSRYPKRWES